MASLSHPDRAKIALPAVLDALSDPTRLAIVTELAESAASEARCQSFLPLASKTNLAYHFAKLRTAGVVHVRQQGTARFLSLRKADLDGRFPGLLDSILGAARRGQRRRRRSGAP